MPGKMTGSPMVITRVHSSSAELSDFTQNNQTEVFQISFIGYHKTEMGAELFIMKKLK
jgi:hypothetical protein